MWMLAGISTKSLMSQSALPLRNINAPLSHNHQYHHISFIWVNFERFDGAICSIKLIMGQKWLRMIALILTKPNHANLIYPLTKPALAQYDNETRILRVYPKQTSHIVLPIGSLYIDFKPYSHYYRKPHSKNTK